MPFDDAFDKVLAKEGGFTNDQRDRGGATRFGITESLARSRGYTGDMALLPIDLARDIARHVFGNLYPLLKSMHARLLSH